MLVLWHVSIDEHTKEVNIRNSKHGKTESIQKSKKNQTKWKQAWTKTPQTWKPRNHHIHQKGQQGSKHKTRKHCKHETKEKHPTRHWKRASQHKQGNDRKTTPKTNAGKRKIVKHHRTYAGKKKANMSITESTAKNAIINKLYYVYDVLCGLCWFFTSFFAAKLLCDVSQVAFMFAVFLFLTFESLLLRCFDDSSACFCVHVWFHFCCVVPFYGCFFGVFLWFEGLLWLAFFFVFLRWVFLFAWLFAICLKHLFCDFHSSFQFWFPHFPYFSCELCGFLYVCCLPSVIAWAARIEHREGLGRSSKHILL